MKKRCHKWPVQYLDWDRWCLALTVTLVTTVLVACFLSCSPQPVHPAVRVRLSWTAPEGPAVRSIEVRARRPDGSIIPITPYADSTGSAAPRLAAPGARQDAWVLVSEDWRAGAWMVAVRSCNGAGCADWSNSGVVIAGAPDTLWHLERIGDGPRMAPRDGVEWKRGAGVVGWSLQSADSVTAADIAHQETVQLRARDGLCRLFGYYALRGDRLPCP